MPLPMIWTDSYVMTLYSDEDLNIAADMAVVNMVKYLTNHEGFTEHDAVMMTSLAADVRICQIVDPKKTVRVEFPVEHLNKDKGD